MKTSCNIIQGNSTLKKKQPIFTKWQFFQEYRNDSISEKSMNSLSHWLTKGKESHFNTHGKYGKNS